MILPTPYTFSPPVLNVSDRPVASGGSGDIFKGTLNRLSICVKRIRVYSKDGPEKATKVRRLKPSISLSTVANEPHRFSTRRL